MPKKKIVSIDAETRFAIRLTYSNNTFGWVLGDGDRGVEVRTFSSKEAAEKAIAQLKKDRHYSWNLQIEAQEYAGFGKEKRNSV